MWKDKQRTKPRQKVSDWITSSKKLMGTRSILIVKIPVPKPTQEMDVMVIV